MGPKAGPFLVLGLTLGSGCGGPSDIEPCSGDVAVSIVRFDPPQFSWEPGCALSSLVVLDAADQPFWLVGDNGDNRIEPPVIYGVVPDGASEEVPPRAFQHGNSYIVRVFRVRRDRSGELQHFQAGEQNFPW